jgi:hypothetical protein
MLGSDDLAMSGCYFWGSWGLGNPIWEFGWWYRNSLAEF